MDPITIGIIGGVIIGGFVCFSDWRAKRPSSKRIEESEKKASREAQKASRNFKKKVEKTVRKQTKQRS
jgi:Na+/glutamate symporter